MQREETISKIYLPTAVSSAMVDKLATFGSRYCDVRLVHIQKIIKCRVREVI